MNRTYSLAEPDLGNPRPYRAPRPADAPWPGEAPWPAYAPWPGEAPWPADSALARRQRPLGPATGTTRSSAMNTPQAA